MRQLVSYLASGDSDRRASCQKWATHSWRQNQDMTLICLCRIINYFSCWLMNAFFSEKRCSTSMAFWHKADWHTNLPLFQGARPDHMRIESLLSCCFPREFVSFARPRELVIMSFDAWHVIRSPPIGKRIWVVRYNKTSFLNNVKTRYTETLLQSYKAQIKILPFPGLD